MRTLPVLAALLSLSAQPADAQAGELESDADRARDEPTDVVVTATRSAVTAFDAPASIARIAGDDFANAGARHQADLLNKAPGVLVQRGSGAESLMAIRSPVLTGAGGCGAFLVAEDSLPIRPVGFCNLNEMFEVNFAQAGAIEVLRGPGSALFGASAVHGIVNVLTPDPRYLPALSLSAESGSDAYRHFSFGVAHEIGDGTGPALAAYGTATRAPGWRDASGVDELKLNLSGDSEVAGGKLQLRAAGSVLNQETAGFIQGYNSYKVDALARSNPNPEAFRDASSARASAQFSRDELFADSGVVDSARLELAALYRRSRMDFSQHFLIGKPLEHNAQTSYLVSGALFLTRGKLNARLALDAEAATSELTEFQPGPATDGAPAANAIRPAGLHYDYGVDSNTVGGTLSFDYELGERWRAGAALRADATNYDYDNHMRVGNTRADGTPCGAAGCLYSRPADREDHFDNVSPRVTLSWNGEKQHYYLNASTGYRPPEMTELYRLQRQQSVADLDSEHVDSVELGWKSRPWNSLEWNLSLFAMDKSDVILRESNGFNVGSGATRHRGVEYSLVLEPLGAALANPVRLTFAGTVARHEYAFSRAIEGGETIIDGNDIDTAPRNIHSVSITWPNVPGKWQSALTWSYVGAYFLDAANTARYPGHQLTDLNLRWRASDQLRVALRVDNVFDTAYADRADFAFGNYRYFPGRGRAAFLSLDYTRR